MSAKDNDTGGPAAGGGWPQPRLRALQVDELYKFAPSATAYSSVKGAHEALSLPATIPTAVNLFFIESGVHWYEGVMALFFVFTIVHFARRLNRYLEEGFKLQIERDNLLALTGILNEKLERENRELAHRVAVRGVSAESARERADRLEALFERSPLPHIECDAAGNILRCNPAAERVFGLREDELAGRALASVLAFPRTGSPGAGAPDQGEVFDAGAQGPGGIRMPCTASITPLPASEGRRPGFAVVLIGLPVAVA